MKWQSAPESRNQLVVFEKRLDDAIDQGHPVRTLDQILRSLDWSAWESQYSRRRGHPPIHPRVLASVILYGLLTKIRASRALEDALQLRMDFRWLVEGRSIDHTTISEFRRKNPEALMKLFVQVGLIAREMGDLPLRTLAFDGTRMRSNNRRSGSRTPDELRQTKKELKEKFQEQESRAQAADQADDEQFGVNARLTDSSTVEDAQSRQEKIEGALAELARLEQEGEPAPKRLPITDPDSRVMPNKDGGYAPNYTPTVTVDVDSGIIVSADVLNVINEDNTLVASVQGALKQFRPDDADAAGTTEVLADGLMATGENLAACEANQIDLYSPVKSPASDDNPAIRDDPATPVAAEDYNRLPMQTVTSRGKKHRRLDKSAFIYDAPEDCYWCPAGKRLEYKNTTTEKRSGARGERVRRRYLAAPDDCAGCPLRAMCLSGKAKSRMVNREQHESLREAHAAKMKTAEAKEKYARRSAVNERPFAAIKQQFGARQFLLRGLSRVKQEWTWLALAYNVRLLIGRLISGAGPPQQPPAVLNTS